MVSHGWGHPHGDASREVSELSYDVTLDCCQGLGTVHVRREQIRYDVRRAAMLQRLEKSAPDGWMATR